VVKYQSAEGGFTAAFKFLSHQTPTFWLLGYFSFNCFVTGNETTITDKLAAADANQIWWFKTNPYSGSLPQPN